MRREREAESDEERERWGNREMRREGEGGQRERLREMMRQRGGER